MLSEGVDILVATPGRLASLMGDGSLRLGACKALVLDEVDVLLGGCGDGGLCVRGGGRGAVHACVWLWVVVGEERCSSLPFVGQGWTRSSCCWVGEGMGALS